MGQAWPINANAASSIQNPKPLTVNQESIKMATKIEQFSYADKVAALTHQYVELGLPLNSALRAAEADLWEPETWVWLFKAVLPPRSDVTRFGKTSSHQMSVRDLEALPVIWRMFVGLACSLRYRLLDQEL